MISSSITPCIFTDLENPGDKNEKKEVKNKQRTNLIWGEFSLLKLGQGLPLTCEVPKLTALEQRAETPAISIAPVVHSFWKINNYLCHITESVPNQRKTSQIPSFLFKHTKKAGTVTELVWPSELNSSSSSALWQNPTPITLVSIIW